MPQNKNKFVWMSSKKLHWCFDLCFLVKELQLAQLLTVYMFEQIPGDSCVSMKKGIRLRRILNLIHNP